MQITPETPSWSRKTEHGQWHRYWHIDTNLPHIDFVDILTGMAAICRENGGAVAVGVGIDELDGVLERVNGDYAEDGAEDLFFVTVVGWEDVG